MLKHRAASHSTTIFLPYLLFFRYHLKDVIVGKIYFLLVRIKIKHMEIDIIKRETTGTGPNVYHENDTIAKYEIMDGAPVRGEPPGLGPLSLCSQTTCSVSALGKGSNFEVKSLFYFIYLFIF
jgi:hypothetical protein